MADNLSVTPGTGAALRTTEAGGVHTPHHHDADRTALIAAIGDVVTALGGQATQDGLDAIADVLAGTLAVSAATLPLPEGAATNTAVEAIVTALGQTLAVSGPLTDAQLAARALATAAKQDALATAVGLLATQSTAAAILAKLSADPATQTTLAAVLAKMIATPATEAKQDANTSAVNLVGTRAYATASARLAVGPASTYSAVITATEVLLHASTRSFVRPIAATGTPTISTDDIPIEAGEKFHMRITSGQRIGVLRDTADGFLNIIPVA